MRYFFHMGLVALVSVAVAQQTAEQCSPDYCRLPDCYCGGKQIPGGYKPEEIPQLVLLTFDDAVNDLNKAFFKKLYEGRKNPNGCPIKVSVKLNFFSQLVFKPNKIHCTQSAGHLLHLP